ncbi:MAG: class I SAM-dependent methyltransferase [Erysipelothrix sp.]|nr:class I SAM-dependent methyltransferase [Erysipelothrix sp.]
MKEQLALIKQKALDNQIPIMSDDSIEYIITNLQKHQCKSILEVGTAVGFSALSIACSIADVNITTIERDRARYDEAVRNIQNLDCQDRINAIFADASEYLCNEIFDAIIIDAAKAQNKSFFDRFFPFVKPRGIVIVDNLDFHGHNEHVELLVDRRNLRQMVNKIKAFEDYVNNRKDLEIERVSVGDGMMMIRRIGHSFNFNE